MPCGHEASRVIECVHIIAKARGYTHASDHNPLVVWPVSSYDAPLCTEAVLVISDSSARSGLLACTGDAVLDALHCRRALGYCAQHKRDATR